MRGTITKSTVDTRFEALLTRDKSFEGRFYMGVKTAKVYCCRICGGRPPLAKNVEIFTHPAETEAAGYRPCKRCRPELAPIHTSAEFRCQLARAMSFNINQGFLADHTLGDLAKKLGVTEQDLQKVFFHEFGVSPNQHWQTHRLLMAKQLLTDSALPLKDVAEASGFSHVQELESVLTENYRLHPEDLRKRQRKDVPKDLSTFRFQLSYRPPLDWDRLLAFLARRAVPEVEAVEDGAYLRTVHIERLHELFSGMIEVKNDHANHRLLVGIAPSLLRVSAVILERLKWVFDLHADPSAVAKVLGALAKDRRGLRVPGSFDTFEMAVRAIIGQQISVVGARTLIGRFAMRFGTATTSCCPLLTHLFPTPERVSRTSVDQIRSVGVTGQRAQSILALARAMAQKSLPLEPGLAVEPTVAKLRQIPGIGEWTAEYIAMRALSWPDAFLHTDLEVRRALGGSAAKETLAKAEKWRPYRAYAVIHLWTKCGEAQ